MRALATAVLCSRAPPPRNDLPPSLRYDYTIEQTKKHRAAKAAAKQPRAHLPPSPSDAAPGSEKSETADAEAQQLDQSLMEMAQAK